MILPPCLLRGALGSHRGQEEGCATLVTQKLYFQRKFGDVSQDVEKGGRQEVLLRTPTGIPASLLWSKEL